MSNLDNAKNLAHEITTKAAEPTRMIRELAKELGLPESDVQSYLGKIVYRRAYNLRPEVIAARKIRNAEKAATQKLIRAKLQAAGKIETLNRVAEGMVK
jgi:predicted solute-binding protein